MIAEMPSVHARPPHPLDPSLCLMPPLSPAAALFSYPTPDFTGRLKHTFLTSHQTQFGSQKKGSINCLKIRTEPVLLAVHLIVFQGCKYYSKTISCDFLSCFFLYIANLSKCLNKSDNNNNVQIMCKC